MASTDPRKKRTALFIDRDGTLIIDKGYLSDPAQVELLPGAKSALVDFVSAGYLLFLFTNQSGVGRGLYAFDDVIACNRRMLDLLELPAPGFAEICIAPEGPDDPIVYRKPSPRFIHEMIARHDLDSAQSWMAGDKLSDVQTALNAGIRPVLLNSTAPVDLPAGVTRCADLKEFATRLFQGQL